MRRSQHFRRARVDPNAGEARVGIAPVADEVIFMVSNEDPRGHRGKLAFPITPEDWALTPCVALAGNLSLITVWPGFIKVAKLVQLSEAPLIFFHSELCSDASLSQLFSLRHGHLMQVPVACQIAGSKVWEIRSVALVLLRERKDAHV